MNRSAHWVHIASTSDDGLHTDDSTVLHRVVVGKAAAGQTLKIHDVAAVADAAAGNLVAEIALDAVGDFAFGARLALGLVTVLSGGTPDITIVHG